MSLGCAHILRERREVVAHVLAQLGARARVERLEARLQVGEQLRRRLEVKLHRAGRHGQQHDGYALLDRLVHLEEAPRAREHALGGEEDEDVGLVHAVAEERAQVRQVVRVEEDGRAEHACEHVVKVPRVTASLVLVMG